MLVQTSCTSMAGSDERVGTSRGLAGSWRPSFKPLATGVLFAARISDTARARSVDACAERGVPMRNESNSTRRAACPRCFTRLSSCGTQVSPFVLSRSVRVG
jgi:hypothetical protein